MSSSPVANKLVGQSQIVQNAIDRGVSKTRTRGRSRCLFVVVVVFFFFSTQFPISRNLHQQ